MIRHLLPVALVLVAGCARSEEASSNLSDSAYGNQVNTVRTEGSDEDEIALGEWRSGLQEDRVTLEFGPSGAPPLFSLSCDARRNTLLQRHGAVPAGDLPVMLVTVGSETRRLAVATVGGAIPMLRATLPTGDPFRTVLTRATIPITVRIGDSPPLVLPQSPAISSYVTACANGENQSSIADANANAARGNQAATANEAAPPAE